MSVIGVDVGGTKIDVGLVSGNRIIKLISEKIKSSGTQKEVISQIISLIDKIFDRGVKAIGVGVPAIVDTEKGMVLETSSIPSWKKVPLKKILQTKYKIPVLINNDANCFALGEKYFGKGARYQNIVAVTLGTGLGAGIIINGKLYCGNNCGAGEFGEIVFKKQKIEYYCSGQFFLKEYKTNGNELFQMAKNGNSDALQIFTEFGDNLGKALSIIVHSVDPEIIILGGSVSKSYKFFKASMMESLKQAIFKKSFRRLKIKVSTTPNITVLGAASLYYDLIGKK